MFTFRIRYFILAVLLFVIEILIAVFLHDGIIRAYVGDFLVVILLYCFVRSFAKLSIMETAVGVLLLAYIIETLQYFNLLALLHLEGSTVANVILGNQFEWIDIIAYTLGIIVVIVVEKLTHGLNISPSDPGRSDGGQFNLNNK